MEDYLRDRFIERPGLTWKVHVDKQLICDGFKTRQQAHDFIDTEIKPFMQNKNSKRNIERMNEFNTIICEIDDKSFVKIKLGEPDYSLSDFNGY